MGCEKGLPPSPVAATIGARKQLHTVIAGLCRGGELCVAPAPVDCIVMVPRSAVAEAPPAPEPHSNRERFHAHNARITRRAQEQAAVLAASKQAASTKSAGQTNDVAR